MPRYIDADALMKKLGITDPDCVKCEWGSKLFPYCTRDGDFVDACDAICEAPTADVVERKRGKWEMKWHDVFKQEVPCCSICHKFTPIKMPYCGLCGADMRGEDDG